MKATPSWAAGPTGWIHGTSPTRRRRRCHHHHLLRLLRKVGVFGDGVIGTDVCHKSSERTAPYWEVTDLHTDDGHRPPTILMRRRPEPSSCKLAEGAVTTSSSLPNPDEGAWLLHAPMLLKVSRYGRRPGGAGSIGIGEGGGMVASAALSRCVATYYSPSNAESPSQPAQRAPDTTAVMVVMEQAINVVSTRWRGHRRAPAAWSYSLLDLPRSSHHRQAANASRPPHP